MRKMVSIGATPQRVPWPEAVRWALRHPLARVGFSMIAAGLAWFIFHNPFLFGLAMFTPIPVRVVPPPAAGRPRVPR